MAFPPVGFPSTGPTPGSTALDQPPPSPTPMGGVDPSSPFSMRGLAGPGSMPSQSMPPEVLTGITQSAQSMSQLLDSWAQITPDKGAQLSLIKDMIQQYLADLMGAGAGPVSPTAAGPAPPMGGIDRGLAGPGAV
jgi:hypothetical protein